MRIYLGHVFCSFFLEKGQTGKRFSHFQQNYLFLLWNYSSATLVWSFFPSMFLPSKNDWSRFFNCVQCNNRLSLGGLGNKQKTTKAKTRKNNFFYQKIRSKWFFKELIWSLLLVFSSEQTEVWFTGLNGRYGVCLKKFSSAYFLPWSADLSSISVVSRFFPIFVRLSVGNKVTIYRDSINFQGL